MSTSKINKAQEYILEFFDTCDPSGENRKIYEERFNNMTDKEFIEFAKSGIIKYYTKPFDIEPSMDDIKAALDFVNVPAEEKITLPFLYEDDEIGQVVSEHKVMILELHLKRLQQMIYKENASVSDISQRDKTNQPIKDSKAAQLSSSEVSALVAKGFEDVPKELLSFRADHSKSKQEAYDNIMTENMTEIPDTINDPDDKIALGYLNVLLYGMNLDSNLISDITDTE